MISFFFTRHPELVSGPLEILKQVQDDGSLWMETLNV